MVKGLARMIVGGGIALGALGIALAPTPAAARVVVGFGFGVPLFVPAPVYVPPPPVYYVPPPPPPAYVPTVAAAPAPPPPANAQCREYSTTSVIGGQPRQVFGTACLQPDGTWRIAD